VALYGNHAGGRSRYGGCVIPRRTTLFASDDSDDALADARAWLALWGYTRDDCKLVKRDGQILVIAERDIEGIKCPSADPAGPI